MSDLTTEARRVLAYSKQVGVAITGVLQLLAQLCDENDGLREANEFYESLTVQRHDYVTSIDGGKTAQKLHELWEDNVRMRDAMQEFVDRVDNGEARSKYTYAKFKALLAGPPAEEG